MCFLVYNAKGQYQMMGADNTATAQTQVAKSSFSSFYSNAAGLGFLTENSAAVLYQKIVPIEGFATLGGLANISFSKFNLGLGFDSFGDKLYRESRIGVAAAKKIDRISIGLKVSYLNTGIKDFSSKHTLLAEAGLMAYLSKKVNIGMSIYNFSRAKLYDSQFLPTIVSIGTQYKPYEKLDFTFQSDYNVDAGLVFRAGMAYALRENLIMRVGVNPKINAINGGLDFKIKKYRLIYAFSSIKNIGLSTDISLVMDLNKEKP